MLNGVAIYSVTLGIISSYFSDRETKSSLIETKAARIEELCQEIGIPEKQKNKMIEAIENSANQMTYFWLDPSHDILTGLPIRLKYEMLVSMYRQLIMECPFFSDLGETCIVRLIPLLKPLALKPNKMVYATGDSAQFSTLPFISLLPCEGPIDVLRGCERGQAQRAEDLRTQVDDRDPVGQLPAVQEVLSAGGHVPLQAHVGRLLLRGHRHHLQAAAHLQHQDADRLPLLHPRSDGIRGSTRTSKTSSWTNTPISTRR